MSRPKPHVLLENINKSTYKSEQILSSDGIWAVFFDGQPINVKSISTYYTIPAPRYKKSSFQNPGFAINLAKKLNKRYKTDLFTVVKLIAGDQIYP